MAFRKKILTFLGAFAFPALLFAEGGVPEISITKEPFFPIIGFNFLWRVNPRIVKDQAEMGLTLITVNSAEELEWCEKAGIRGIVYQPPLNRFLHAPDAPELEQEITAAVNGVKNSGAFYGMQYTDEPSKSVLPGYAKAYAAIKKAAPEHPVYTCLFPSWATSGQHGFDTYEEYVEAFCKLVSQYPAPVLSYDSYRNKDLRLKPLERIASFLENLDTVRRITLKYDIPFQVTVLAAAHDRFGDPTAADLDFEVFASLAYGAKGIGYFTTVSHPNGLFQGGPFNVLGDKTPIYGWMRELNFRVRRLAPVLSTLRSTGCYYSLSPKAKAVFKSYPMLQPLPGELVLAVNSEYENGMFLVGEFKDPDNGRWVMIVNLNPTDVANFKAVLKGGKKLQHFNSYTGQLFPVQAQDPWLRPGQGKLYKVVD